MGLKDNLIKNLTTSLGKEKISGQELAGTVKSIDKEINKLETAESTGSGSAGSFEGPLFSKMETNEKWTEKYKKSIDCNNPKGFSQRAHCQGKKKKLKENLTEAERTIMAKLRDLAKKYAQGDSKDETSKEKIEKIYQDLKKQFNIGVKVEKEHKSGDPKLIALDHLSEDPKYYSKLKKIEANEATGSMSSGSYETPSFLAKSKSPKKWRGASKTQIPGGKFVKVKEKCKKFPYCNQGDIKALDLFENKFTNNIIEKLSEEFNLDKKIISNILIKEINKTK